MNNKFVLITILALTCNLSSNNSLQALSVQNRANSSISFEAFLTEGDTDSILSNYSGKELDELISFLSLGYTSQINNLQLHEIDKSNPELGMFFIALATLHYFQGHTKNASNFWEKGKRIIQGASEKEIPDIPRIYKKIVRLLNPLSKDLKIEVKDKNEFNDLMELFDFVKDRETISLFSLPSTADAETFFDRGELSLELSDIRYAMSQYKKAANLYEKVDDWENLVTCYRKIGTNILMEGDFKNNFLYIKKALEIGIENFGYANSEVGKSFGLLAWAYFMKGYYNNAIHFWEKGIKILEGLNDNYDMDLAFMYSNIGLVYDQKGDHGMAKKYYERSLPILMKVYKSSLDIIDKGLCGTYLGHIYNSKGEYDIALRYLNEARELVSYKNRKGEIILPAMYFVMGEIYSSKEDYENSLISFNNSLNIGNFLGFNSSQLNTLLNKNIGNLHYKIGNYDQAHEYILKAMKSSIELLGEDHAETIENYKWLGKVMEKQNRYFEALEYYEKAITGTLERSSKSYRQMLAEDYFIEPFSNKANLLTKLYYEETNEKRDLVEVLATYEEASKLIEKMRNSYKAEDSKLSLSEKAISIYEGAIKTCLKLYEISGKPQYKELAFVFAEKNKAGVLVESLTDLRAKYLAGIPNSLLETEKKLKVEQAFFRTELNKEKQKKEKQDASKIQEYKKKLFEIDLEYRIFLSKLEKEFPEYYDLKYNFDVISVKELQEKIESYNTVVVEYFISDSLLYIFTVDKINYEVTISSVPSNKEIRELNNSIYNVDSEEYLDYAYRLHSKLVAPISDKIYNKHVLVIPDGVLHYVPFDALLSKKLSISDKLNFRNLPYLIKHHEFSYEYSATMAFSELTSKHEEKGNNGFVGFAPVFIDGSLSPSIAKLQSNEDVPRLFSKKIDPDDNFRKLPGSEEEIKQIYKLFKQKNLPAKMFLRANASEDVLKDQSLVDYRYLHLATHAFVNESNSKLSGIVFAKNESTEDGILFTDEVYNLELNADLVVLSSCESGIGKLVKGEGILGFTRGLIYGGAKNVVVSLWEVVDNSTSKLMTNFYKHILENKSYSKSLRESKLEMINEKRNSPPRYWAPFILVGQ